MIGEECNTTTEALFMAMSQGSHALASNVIDIVISWL